VDTTAFDGGGVTIWGARINRSSNYWNQIFEHDIVIKYEMEF
jgi:phage tail sheath protein FI